MGITFDQLQKRLIGAINVIPASAARVIINDSLREIYDEYDWGFLYQEDYIRTPEIIEGTVNVTKFQPIIIVDLDVQAKINAITENDISLFERQVRLINPTIQDRSLTYNILDYDNNTGELTLDKPYQDATNLVVKIQILKIFYTAPYFIPPYDPAVDAVPDPIIDFRRFESIISPQFRKRLHLEQTLTDLDRIDPRRLNFLGETKTIVANGKDLSGNQLFELYPVSRQERLLKVKYLRNGAEMRKPNEELNPAFSAELVLAKAKKKAYEWCMANAHLIPNVGSVGRFNNLIALLESPNNSSSYSRLLAVAKKKDEELFPQSYLGDFYLWDYWDWNYGYYDGDPTLPHDSWGDTLVIDAATPTIETF